MSQENWYSAKLRRVCLVEGKVATLAMESIHIFRAQSFEGALARAVAIGRELDEDYRNSDGAHVKWRLKEVVSLDLIRSDNLDGAEIHSQFADVNPNEGLSFDSLFTPEASTPGQTI